MNDNKSEYEKSINKLSTQITELFTHIFHYQSLVSEKEVIIAKLKKENSELKNQIEKLYNRLHPTSYPDQNSYTPKTPPQQMSSKSTPDTDTTMKRQCPNCGASGFAIKEVDDKTTVLAYGQRRIYAKKKVCTKCRFEFK